MSKVNKDESFSSALADYIQNTLKDLREWLRPEPEDSLFLKIVKGIFKTIALLILTIISPVILLVLLISFFAAF